MYNKYRINMKKLEKSVKNRKFLGVCEGLGKYLEVDPVIFRIGFLACTFIYGGGLLLYLIAALVMPNEKEEGTE